VGSLALNGNYRPGLLGARQGSEILTESDLKVFWGFRLSEIPLTTNWNGAPGLLRRLSRGDPQVARTPYVALLRAAPFIPGPSPRSGGTPRPTRMGPLYPIAKNLLWDPLEPYFGCPGTPETLFWDPWNPILGALGPLKPYFGTPQTACKACQNTHGGS
jgi:hypothetical protein